MTDPGAVERPRGRLSRPRLWVVGSVLAFVLIFRAAYLYIVVPRFEYFGAGRRDLPFLMVASIILFSVLPALWLPVALKRPSQILTWTLYLLVYIPTQTMAYASALPRLEEGRAFALCVTLLGGMFLLSAAQFVAVPRLRRPRVAQSLIWLALSGAFVALFAYLFVTTRELFQVVSFRDVDEHRNFFLAMTRGSFVGYALAWAGAVFNPLLFASFVCRRRWGLAALILLCQAALYGVAGSKGVALSVVVLPALAVLVRMRKYPFGSLMTAGATFFCLLPWVFDLLGFRLIAGLLTAVTLFRALVIPGLATTQYAGFFEDHPLTYGSHVTGLSSLLHYPYSTTLDYTLGDFYYNTGNKLGLNANLWAGDGIAGFGLPGILLISAAGALVFWMLDTAAEGLDPRFTVVALTYGVVNFSNVSLMTNLVTGGIALMMLLFYLWPRTGPEGLHA